MKKRILALYLPTPPKFASLPELAETLMELSPHVGIRPDDILYLEVSHAQNLYGSERNAVKKLRATLEREGIEAQIAIADDLASAGVLARRHPSNELLVPPGKVEKFLGQIPVEELIFLVNPLSPPSCEEIREARHAIHVLKLLGITNLGGFARLPAATIGSRFGKLGVELHQRSRGRSQLSFSPFLPTRTFRKRHNFDNGVHSLEPVLFAGRKLLEELEGELKKQFQAALECSIFLETEDCEEIELGIPLFRPLRKAKALFDVMKERLSRVHVKAPIISFSFEIVFPVENQPSQFHLFHAYEEQGERLDELLGRLVAGLGPQIVSAAELRERYRPESSWKPKVFDPLQKVSSKERNERKERHLPLRPNILLPEPERLFLQKRSPEMVLAHQRGRFEVSRLHGPERIQTEWWDKSECRRDYFVAETKGGQNLWLFRKPPNTDFYLHGYFD